MSSETDSAVKKPCGRPTKYIENEIQSKSDEYVDGWELFLEIKDKKDPEKITHLVNSIPSIASLAMHLGVHRDTIYEWEKKYQLFSDTLERLRQKQESFLIHHGLTKGYDSGFAKFLTVNLTRYRDKIESTHDVGVETKKLIINMNNKIE